MGFLRGVGYFFAILILLFGIISLVYGVAWVGVTIIIFAIIVIAILRHFGKQAQMRQDIHYLAERERQSEEEAQPKLTKEEKKIAEDEKKIAELEKMLEEKRQKEYKQEFDRFDDSGNNEK